MPSTNANNLPPESKHGEVRAPRRRSGVNALVGFLVVVVAVIFVMSVFFRVSDIRVEGNEHYTDQEIINASGIEEGDNLFFFDKFSALSRAYTKLPYLEEVTVDRRLPGRVTINVKECKAMAYLSLGDENWTIDHSCKVLGKAVDTELSELIPVYGVDPGTLMIGEKLERADGSEEMVDYLAMLLLELQERGISDQTRRIDFSDPYRVSFALGDRFTVVVGGPMKLDHKFAMLFSVLEQLKDGDTGTIDVSDGSTARFIPY